MATLTQLKPDMEVYIIDSSYSVNHVLKGKVVEVKGKIARINYEYCPGSWMIKQFNSKSIDAVHPRSGDTDKVYENYLKAKEQYQQAYQNLNYVISNFGGTYA